jgi:hypothetical protein
VKQLILEEPKRLDMDRSVVTAHTNNPPCGTAGCIAGWVNVLTRSKKKAHWKQVATKIEGLEWTTLSSRAQQELDIDSWQAERLFYQCNWPNHMGGDYDNAGTGTTEAAKITAKRIDRFIKTKGAE